MKPTLVTMPPRELRERLQTDPTLLALLEQGYSLGTSCVLVDGPEGPDQRMEFALILIPPKPPAPPAQVSLPAWVGWWAATSTLLLLGVLVATATCAIVAIVAG